MKPSIRVGENLYIDVSRKNEICLYYEEDFVVSKYSHEGVNTLKSFITSLKSLIEGGDDIYKMALREMYIVNNKFYIDIIEDKFLYINRFDKEEDAKGFHTNIHKVNKEALRETINLFLEYHAIHFRL